MRRGKSVIWLSLLMLLAFVVSAHANSILDQDNPPFGDLHGSDNLEWQQQVTATFGQVLSGITLYTLPPGSDTALVRIGVGSAPFTGQWAFETKVTIGPGGTFIDTSSANIALNPHDSFVIDVSGGLFQSSFNLAGSTRPYWGGDFYLNYDGQFLDYTQAYGYSLAFQTYMNTEVPEPGTLVFLGTGVLGVAGMLRRKLS